MGLQTDLQSSVAHGVCVKALDGTVLSQNDKCIEICGNMQGRVCEKGCMLNRTLHPSHPELDEGISHLKGIRSDDHLVDAVLLNDGQTLTTYLLDKSATVDRKLSLLKPFDLSEAELKTAGLVLEGRTNREIAGRLFISLSTVRTHLGNLYRKIPEEIRKVLFR